MGLTLRVVSAVDYDEPRDAISHDWIQWLGQYNIHPILIPNVLAEPRRYAEAEGLDGLILTSGNDVVSRDAESDVSPTRDRTESALIDWAVAAKKPVFAVCRGAHMVNAYFGGRMRADLVNELPTATAHIASSHTIRFETPFASLLGSETATTNSYHRQGILLKDLAPQLYAFARCETDGVVEGLVHRELPILGIQWHPERMGSCVSVDDLLLKRLLQELAFWRGRLG